MNSGPARRAGWALLAAALASFAGGLALGVPSLIVEPSIVRAGENFTARVEGAPLGAQVRWQVGHNVRFERIDSLKRQAVFRVLGEGEASVSVEVEGRRLRGAVNEAPQGGLTATAGDPPAPRPVMDTRLPEGNPSGGVVMRREDAPTEAPGRARVDVVASIEPGRDGRPGRIYSCTGAGDLSNGPTVPTMFESRDAIRVTAIRTIHWNDRRGATPGTIGLEGSDGKKYGPWPARSEGTQSRVLNACWLVEPDAVIPPGVYTVVDSDPATWSCNGNSGGRGFVLMEGLPAGDSP